MSTSKKKPKAADTLHFVWDADNEPSVSKPVVDVAMGLIIQWAAIERFEVTSAAGQANRESVRAKLRKVAEHAVNAEHSLFIATQSGRKGGSRPKGRDAVQDATTKRARIEDESAKYRGSDAAKVTVIARRAGATPQYVRTVLRKIGN